MAALRVAGRGGRGVDVTLVNDRDHFVERIRLHQMAVGGKLPVRSIAKMIRGTGVRLLVGRVGAIDAEKRRVSVSSEEGERDISYDALIYALGSGPADSGLEGVRRFAENIATEVGARKLADRLAALPSGGRVSVVGGGLTGIEAATEIAEARPDLGVRLVSDVSIGAGLSEAGGAAVFGALAELRVETREYGRVAKVTKDSIVFWEGDSMPSDVTIWCAGFAPNALGRSSGLACTRSGRLALDPFLRSVDAPEIFGAGDGAAIASAEAEHIRMACATAMPLGAHAADNALAMLSGRRLEPFGFGFFGQCISLGRKRGIVQRVTHEDVPVDSVVTGRFGARLKEAVCRFTIAALAMERLIAGTYSWPRRRRAIVAGRAPAALPASIG
ncbi:MAG: FAD-dependent oxidoreductase [Polyangiaceae bacterium]|nr:FAD-dependent oxidoreductase [Polyangiaceae bacterium]